MKFPDLTRGMCREVGVDLFFPDEGRSGIELYSFARKICAGCSVKNACLEWAIKHEDHGMWGGTTPVDRRNIRRKRNMIIQEVYVKDYV